MSVIYICAVKAAVSDYYNSASVFLLYKHQLSQSHHMNKMAAMSNSPKNRSCLTLVNVMKTLTIEAVRSGVSAPL